MVKDKGTGIDPTLAQMQRSLSALDALDTLGDININPSKGTKDRSFDEPEAKGEREVKPEPKPAAAAKKEGGEVMQKSVKAASSVQRERKAKKEREGGATVNLSKSTLETLEIAKNVYCFLTPGERKMTYDSFINLLLAKGLPKFAPKVHETLKAMEASKAK